MQNCSTSIASAVCVGNGIVIYQHNNLYQLSAHNLSSSIELSNINVVATKSTYFNDKPLCLNMFLGSDNTPLQSTAGLTMILTHKTNSYNVEDSTITDTCGQIGSGILATFIGM